MNKTYRQQQNLFCAVTQYWYKKKKDEIQYWKSNSNSFLLLHSANVTLQHETEEPTKQFLLENMYLKLNCDKKEHQKSNRTFEYFYDYITQFFINGFAELTWPKIYGRMPNCKDIPLDMWGNRNNYERNAMDFCSNGIKLDMQNQYSAISI